MTSMEAAISNPADELAELTSGLYRFILAAEPALLSRKQAAEEAMNRLVEHAHSLSERFSQARARAAERISTNYDEISTYLSEIAAELDSWRSTRKDRKALWQGLGENYEALAAYIRQLRTPTLPTARIGELKPRNLTRNIFHVSMALIGVLTYELWLSRTGVLVLGGSIMVSFIFLDIVRRVSPTWNERLVQRIFGKISRPSEAHRIPSSNWYMASLWLGCLLLPQHAIEVGVLVLGFGDPVASLAGKKWGRVKLYGDKSVAGTTAFFVVSMIVAAVFLMWIVPGVSLTRGIGIAAVVAFAGAFTELFSGRVDDNFTIPLFAGGIAALLLAA